MPETHSAPETRRIEALWAGEFGDEYIGRNTEFDQRKTFWQSIMQRHSPANVLEVGCSIGGNLRWIAEQIDPNQVYGVDISATALKELHTHAPGINTVWSPARELPFRDRWFDLVFTMGVLIHQPDSTLPLAMSEMVRCSRRFVLCGEYLSEETEEVPYRGQMGALFRRNYGGLFLELFPELETVDQGFLSRDDGWDDVTWWLFERRA